MFDGSDNNMLWYIVVPAIVILTTMMLRSTRRKLRDPGASPKAYAREQVARLKDQQNMKDDMGDLLVELQELSRQISAQIDTKFAKLEASIRAADERIATLERLQQQTDGKPTVDTIVDDQSPAPPPTAAAAPADPPAPSPADPHRDDIYRFADQGKSAIEIAQETGRSTGEVELILALRKKPLPQQ